MESSEIDYLTKNFAEKCKKPWNLDKDHTSLLNESIISPSGECLFCDKYSKKICEYCHTFFCSDHIIYGKCYFCINNDIQDIVQPQKLSDGIVTYILLYMSIYLIDNETEKIHRKLKAKINLCPYAFLLLTKYCKSLKNKIIYDVTRIFFRIYFDENSETYKNETGHNPIYCLKSSDKCLAYKMIQNAIGAINNP